MNQTNFLIPAMFAKSVTSIDTLSGTAQTVAIAKEVKMIVITVKSNNAFLKWNSSPTLTSSNFDIPLVEGRNDVAVPFGVTSFQLLGESAGDSVVRIAQF